MVLKGKFFSQDFLIHTQYCSGMFGDGTISKDGVPKTVHDTFLLGQPLAFVGSSKDYK